MTARFPKPPWFWAVAWGASEEVELKAQIPYGEITGFPVSTVAGHKGALLIGHCRGLPIVCLQGRMHLYEGYDPAQLAVPIRTLASLGVKRLLLTNAAGSLDRAMPAGSLMLLLDHLNMSGRNPLVGPNDERFGPRFPDMSEPYDAGLRALFLQAASELGLTLHQGVYAQTSGPNFETPAEVRMLGILGAQAVGMSTVPECLVAKHCGMQVAAVSVITNLAAGLQDHALSHAETLHEADKAYERMRAVFLAVLTGLAGQPAQP